MAKKKPAPVVTGRPEPLTGPVDLRTLIDRERERRGWSYSELDRRAGLWIGVSNKFLKHGRDSPYTVVTALVNACGFKVSRES